MNRHPAACQPHPLRRPVAGYGALLILWLVAQPALWGQVQAGRIVGTVTDPSQAIIVGARVTVTNTQTNVVHSAETGAAGDYVVTPLQPGVYRIAVTAAGFQTMMKTGIELTVGQFVQVDVRLPVGEASSKVEVVAEIPQVDTESGSLGQVVNNTQITTLPLNGRNFAQLAALAAGAIVLPNTSTYSNRIRPNYISGLTISGVTGGQIAFLTDGVDVTDNLGGTYIQTSIDAIQEFRLQQNAYSAEFGRAGGAYNLTTQSGTNAVHGRLFEFLRNDKFDARNFFATGKDVLKQNQFGGTIGAPLSLPKLYNGKDRTFLFASYDATRQRQGVVNNLIVPSAAMLAGDFSATGLPAIYDPASVQTGAGGGAVAGAFPGNVIPKDRLSSQAQFFNQYIPAPNLASTTASFAPSRALGLDQFTIRGDHTAADRHKIFLRWSLFDNRLDDPNAFPTLGIAPLRTRGQNVAASLNNTLTPRVIHELRFSYLRGTLTNTPFLAGKDYNQAAGITGFEELRRPGLAGSFPDFSWSGYSSMRGSGFDQRPKTQDRQSYQVLDNITWIAGRHVVKAGGEFKRLVSLFADSRSYAGVWSFTGAGTQNPVRPAGTGSPWADWALGLPYSSQRGYYTNSFGGVGNYWNAFLQDDIKLTRRLALNLGLRYEYSPWVSGYRGQIGTFDGRSDRPVIVASKTETPDLSAQPAAPVAYSFFKSLIQTSSQAGLPLSITYPDKRQFAPRFGFAWTPFGGRTVVRGGYGIFYEGETTNTRTTITMIPFKIEETVYSTSGAAPRRTLADFFLGQALGSAASVPVIQPTYTHLPMGYDQHWNVGLQQALQAATVLEVNYVGNKGSHQLSTNYFNLPPAGAGDIQSRRPYPRFGSSYYTSADAASLYHSLQAKLERRPKAGLWYLASYTFSKNIVAQFAPAVGGNTARERSLSGSDVPHNFVLSGGYEVPVGRGRHFLSGKGGLTNAVLGGWQVQGIWSSRSGLPFTPTISRDVANIGQGGQRPTRIASGALESPSLDRWFDRSAFLVPAAYTFGNSGGSILRAGGLKNLDCSVFKEFPAGERAKLVFRAEFFNVSNTPSFLAPSGVIDASSGAIVTATSTAPRQIQLALKYLF